MKELKKLLRIIILFKIQIELYLPDRQASERRNAGHTITTPLIIRGVIIK